MISELGEKIIKLRLQGMSVRKIAKTIPCGMGSVSKFAMMADNHESQTMANILKANEGRRKVQERKEAIIFDISKNKQVSRNRLLRLSKKTWLVFAAGGKCQLCNYSKCLGALDFHHLADKDFDISRHRNMTLSQVLIEAKKCALLCRNCHAETHFKLLCKEQVNLNPVEIEGEIPEDVVLWYLDSKFNVFSLRR